MAIIVRRAFGDFDRIESGQQVHVRDDGSLVISHAHEGMIAAYSRDTWTSAYTDGDCQTFETEADAVKLPGA